jgi:amino acid adenylation domain-containing protein
LWTLSNDGDSPYRSSAEVRILGPLDVNAFRQAVDETVARHEILRTSFYASDGMSLPLQVIHDAGPSLSVVDLSDVAAGRRPSVIDEIRDRAGRRRYDFSNARLTGLTLVVMAPGEHLLLVDLPALCCDGSGVKRLVDEVCRRYECLLRGATLDGEPLQYVDASGWLNEALTSDESAAGREFWQQQDVTLQLSKRLPFEMTPPAGAPFLTNRLPVELSPEVRAQLPQVSRSLGVSVETFLLTCMQCLLQRATGDTELAMGLAWDGRGYAELDDAIGVFARQLPLSGEIPEELPLAVALRLVDERVVRAREWGACFDWSLLPGLADASGPLAYVPFVFKYEQWPVPQRMGELEIELQECDAKIDRFKLRMVCRGLSDVFLDYDQSLYARRDIARLAEQFAVLVADALARPSAAVSELQLLPEAQREELLLWSRADGQTFPDAECVHRLFEAAASRAPDETAIVCEDESLSYSELNSRANQLAHHLRGLGVGPETLVGLCLERSVDVIVAILGILKAGGAYVPLDPHLPKARLASMIGDSGARVVVTAERFRDNLPDSTGAVALDGDRDAISARSRENPEGGATPGNAVYVLFTSGSTGNPKGVTVEHRHLAHYTRAIAARLDLPARASFAAVTTFAADLGNTSVYPALSSGGCLHIVTEGRASDAEAFASYMQAHEIDVLKIVPSHLKALLSGRNAERVLPRRRLILGGEACSWDLADQVARLAPELVVLNHYGPTETTVGATTFQIRRETRSDLSATVPIGRPLADARVYVLDGRRRLVPVWFPGELYIGGSGVSRGYFNDPGMNRERFIPDPVEKDGGRFYRTGDSVRMLPTGDLEFLGRTDSQIKIRGFRVELGEVEAALRRHEAVRDSAVIVREIDAGEKRLVGCVALRSGSNADAAALSAFLKSQLPDYMVPGAFVFFDALPLNANGKIDRRALAARADSAPSSAAAGSAQPSTEWEALVADIWRELLRADEVGVHDNFYDLGGHSLLAIQVVTALERRTRLHMNPRDLVFHTLRQFAALCESRLASSPEPI